MLLGYLVFSVYLVSSVVTFFVYLRDKSAAANGRWRTEESTLHLFGLIGGWPGALVAQRCLRHKLRKPSFQFAFWITVGVNCMVMAWLTRNELIPLFASMK